MNLRGIAAALLAVAIVATTGCGASGPSAQERTIARHLFGLGVYRGLADAVEAEGTGWRGWRPEEEIAACEEVELRALKEVAPEVLEPTGGRPSEAVLPAELSAREKEALRDGEAEARERVEYARPESAVAVWERAQRGAHC